MSREQFSDEHQPPWTVVSYRKRLRSLWKDVRGWLVAFVLAFVGLVVTYPTAKTRPVPGDLAPYQRPLVKIPENPSAVISVLSVVVMLITSGPVSTAFWRHYRCPKCSVFAPGFGVECSSCGARLR